MKKFLFAFCILLVSGLSAQSPIEVGQGQINAGLGLSNYGLPVYVGFDYGVHEDITAGAEFSYRSYNENLVGVKYDFSILGFSVNCNYHFNTLLDIAPEFDVYGGANIGFYSWSSPSGYKGNRTSGLGLGLQIGGRYYFNDKLGVNLELGRGNASSGGKIGISIRL